MINKRGDIYVIPYALLHVSLCLGGHSNRFQTRRVKEEAFPSCRTTLMHTGRYAAAPCVSVCVGEQVGRPFLKAVLSLLLSHKELCLSSRKQCLPCVLVAEKSLQGDMETPEVIRKVVCFFQNSNLLQMNSRLFRVWLLNKIMSMFLCLKWNIIPDLDKNNSN